jgi:hypothetical protein
VSVDDHRRAMTLFAEAVEINSALVGIGHPEWSTKIRDHFNPLMPAGYEIYVVTGQVANRPHLELKIAQ